MSLIDGCTEVEASWPEVRAKAGQLNQVCVASPSELSRIQEKGMEVLISLLYGIPRLHGGNGTLDEALS